MKKLLPLILILFAAPCFGDEETFNAVLSGKTCKTISIQTITCMYEVSDSLTFEITSIGTYDAVITFFKIRL